jgi:hypothetical protein
MAGLVCEATRRAALDGTTSALRAVEDQPPHVADVMREIAEPILSRATIMQIEIDRFMAVVRCRRGAEGSAAAVAGRSSGRAVRRPVDARLRRAQE